jgi:hypothetical protein
MGKNLINTGQCKIPEELFVQTQMALVVIMMNSVTEMVESYFSCLCTVLVLRESGKPSQRHERSASYHWNPG